ncbi:MAG: hypothetical protein M3457_22770, partial [Chloroflexota bacterium]|nr:hypothetical protein [Chloroflexota bacterium]
SQAVPSGNAYQVTSVLTDNDAREMVFGPTNLFGQTQEQLGRPTAAKSGTTDDWKDLWTMGYTTDVAIGVWVGVSGGANTVGLVELDGSEAAGPIWQDMMVEIHNNAAFSSLLNGPNGNPLPEAFPVPDDAYEGEICAVTGHRPGQGATTEEWLVRDQGPDQDCGELSDWEREQLDEAIAATREGGVRWAGDAVNTIARYASAAGVSGMRVQQDDRQDSNSNTNDDSDSGSSSDDVPIESIDNQPDDPAPNEEPPPGEEPPPDEGEPDPPPDATEPVIEPAG